MTTSVQLLTRMAYDGIEPSKVDETDDNTMYIGFCLPGCTGVNDPKWLIKLVKTQETEKTISFANGSKLFNQAWSNRLNLTYKVNELFPDE